MAVLLTGRLPGWAALVAVALVVSGCEQRGSARDASSRHNIVLIVIDTLRADHLGCYGYFRDTSPNLDAFAEQAVFFEQAYAPMATTLPSHASLFTGVYPLEHGIFANFGDGGSPFRSRPELRTFAEVVQANGYATAAFVSAAPLKRACGLDAGFDLYDQPQGATRTAPQVTDAALAWLDRHGSERFFLFVHYFDPHVPYRPPASYRALFLTDARLEAYLAEREIPEMVAPALCRGRVPTVTRQATNLYDAEIRFCDEHVGRLLDSLRERGLWDRSVIVLTADHGEGLNQHEWPQHGRTWNEQVHVPLMMRFPGWGAGRPKRFAPLVSLIDVLPTVLGQMKPPWAEAFMRQASGVDALASGFQERPVLSQRSARDCGDHGGPLYALTDEQWRYHLLSVKNALLFDRLADPHELRDAVGGEPARADAMRRELLELIATLKQRGQRLRAAEAAAPELSTELLREMEALGYTGGSSAEDDDEEQQKTPASAPATRPAGP